MPMLPPDAHASLFADRMRDLQSGGCEPDQKMRGLPVTLYQWVRARKLIELVGSEAAALAYVNMEPALYARATQQWGGLAYTPDVGARARYYHDKLDLTEEVKRIRDGQSPNNLLLPDPAVFQGPSGEVWALGRFWVRKNEIALRAVAFESGKEIWRNETRGLGFGCASKSLILRPPLLYLGQQSTVTALDVQTGRLLWQVALQPDELIAQNPDGSPAIHDPGQGVVMVRLQSHTLLGLSAPTGARLYKIAIEQHLYGQAPSWQDDDKTFQSEDIPGVGVVVVGGNHWRQAMHILEARTGRPLHTPNEGGSVRVAKAFRGALVYAMSIVDSPQSSIHALDAASGGQLLPRTTVSGLASQDAPVFAGPWIVFRSTHDRGVLFAIAWPGHSTPQRELVLDTTAFDGLAATEDALVATLRAEQSESIRLCVLDAKTLQERGKTSELGPRLKSDEESVLAVHGDLAVLATGHEQEGSAMLWGMDLHRGARWAFPVQGYRNHRFVGSRIVVWAKDETLLVRREDGASMVL